MKWEQWEIDRVVEFWSKGATSGEIGEMIGRTGVQVRSFIKNHRDKLGLTMREDDITAKPVYDSDFYYLPKYHWLISKSWSST